MNIRVISGVFPFQQVLVPIYLSLQLASFQLHAADAMSFETDDAMGELTRGPYLQSGTPHSVIVRWRTSVPGDSRVSYGTNPNNLNRHIVYATQTTEHEVELGGLMADTKYFYEIGSASTTLAGGPDYFFVTSPLRGTPTRIWVIGDSGTANSSARAVRDAYYNYAGSRHTDLWLMLGDNAYGIGTDAEYQSAVFEMYPEMLRQTVLWPTIGNHDTYSTGSDGRFPYLDIFTLPTGGEAGGVPSGTEKYYSYDYGNIHFVVLDAMSSDRSSNGPMCSWLQTDLAGNTNDWLIAYWHHPPYTKGSHDSDAEIELIQMRENALPILESYGADLVLCGHSHSYERSYLINGHYGYSGSLISSMILDRSSGRAESAPYTKASTGPAPYLGTVYAVAGCSGQTSGGALNHPVMVTSLNELGSLVLDIDGQTLEAKFLRESGEIDDHFTIMKGVTAIRLRITSIAISENVLTLTWNSSAQTNYRVQRSTNLQSALWTTISPDISGRPDTTSWSHSLAGAPANAFYRVFGFPD
jgi:hypothetical protein